MVQMVSTLRTVLLSICLAEVAFVTYTREEANADQRPYIVFLSGLGAWPQRDDTANTFMAANVRELDVRYGISVGASGGAAGCVQVFVSSVSEIDLT